MVINHAYPNNAQDQEVKQVIRFAKEDPIKSNLDSEINQAVAFSESAPVMTLVDEEEIEYVIDYSIPDDDTDRESDNDLESSIDSAKTTLANIEKEMNQKIDQDDETEEPNQPD